MEREVRFLQALDNARRFVRDRIDLEQQAAKLEIREVEQGENNLKLGVLELPSFYGDGDPRTKRQGSRDVRRLIYEAREAKVDGIVLDPPWLRVDLLVLALRHGDNRTGLVDERTAGARGSLVDGENSAGHAFPSR